MAQQTFRSPNFFDREIDLSAPAPVGPAGVPAGIIGTANRGPAFIPVTVGNWDQFVAQFGDLDPKRFGPYAANAYLANRQALTFLRVLGAGANATATDVARTQETGEVVSAGFHLDGDSTTVLSASGGGKVVSGGDPYGRYDHCVQFLVAQHTKQAAEAFGQADFTDNDSFHNATVNLVRGVVLLASGTKMMVADYNRSLTGGAVNSLSDAGLADAAGNFKLIFSSTLGNSYYNQDGNPGVHIVTASLNPSAKDYFGKVLNTDPDKFDSALHLLYSDFAVDDEIATAANNYVAVVSGTNNVSTTSGDNTLVYRKAFGAFNTRYKTPTTSFFISQPFGATEYDLFRIEALDDGAYANNLFKVSIVNLKASLDAANKYGTFAVQIRAWDDNDTSPNVLEQFNNCTLDPTKPNYVAQVIGDRKLYYNFDATDPNERRVVASGKYANQSAYVRVVMNEQVNRGQVPAQCLPFGFRGPAVLKTNDSLTDAAQVGSVVRISGVVTGSAQALSGAIVPPVPFRSKVTKGQRPTTAAWFGEPGITELAIPLYYWGVKFERNDIPLDPNLETAPNGLLSALTQFQGLSLLDTVVTGAGADRLNDNKFTLAKVAFSNTSINDLTASVDAHMREAAYVRNGVVDTTQYTVNDGVLGNRITFATLLGKAPASTFNRFNPYLKFSTFVAGGFDGVNFLDSDSRRMNDRASSFDADAAPGFVPAGFSQNQTGTGQSNATVASYVAGVNIMTDPMRANHNLLAIPGIREPFITDYTGQKVRDYGLAYYVMDVEKYDESINRLFDDSTTKPDVNQTSRQFDSRALDNNYAGTYFPDIFIDDKTNRRRVKVPASVAALGALGFNDRVGYPWFAPAGFNRAALDFVTNVEVRLTSSDRDTLYDSRINPIATFPRQGFVVWGQKTLQVKNSALNRVNVRRMLVEVKRIIKNIALQLEFEQNTPAVWATFTAQASLQLGLIQSQQGIEAFQVVMNETNNTQADVDQNKLNGRIVVVPTRAIEFIAVDFIITNSGVQFV